MFLMRMDCKCCQKAARNFDLHHCKDCWNKFHHGKRDNDWISKEEFIKRDRGRTELIKLMLKEI